jgi:diaminohydroxyphosphoribosylaminopyrimidine deaminase / 5-amino-6-(5-phosphoribosylamino)uracil reductase
MADTRQDEKYMSMALELAEKGRGTASPNPMVGAVIVKDGKVVGKGWHKRPGTPHAEAVALEKAGALSEDATIYVNLEPCCHRDKLTPPCADAIIRHRVARVVIGMVDPNPKVSGKGIQVLRDAGIQVDLGVMGERCERLNEAFSKHITTGMPFVTLKVAQTLDGKIATSSGDSKWITGPDARRLGHRLRSHSDAIMVGIDTVLKDDPSLTTRLEEQPGARDPHRVILDSRLRIPLDAKVLNQTSKSLTYIATTIDAPTAKLREIKKKKAEILILDKDESGMIDMPSLMQEISKLGMTSVLVEGGAHVNASALRSGMVDKVVFFLAPKLLGGDDARGSIGGGSPDSLDKAVELTCVSHTTVGRDIMVEGYIAGKGGLQVCTPARKKRRHRQNKS